VAFLPHSDLHFILILSTFPHNQSQHLGNRRRISAYRQPNPLARSRGALLDTSSTLPIPMRALLAGARRKQPALLKLPPPHGRNGVPFQPQTRRRRLHGPRLRSRPSPRRSHQAPPSTRLRQPASKPASAHVALPANHRLHHPHQVLPAPILILGHLDTVWPWAPSAPCPGGSPKTASPVQASSI